MLKIYWLISFLIFFTIPLVAKSEDNQNIDFKENDIKNPDIRPQDVVHWEDYIGKVKDSGEIEIHLRLKTSRGFSLYSNKLKFSTSLGKTFDEIVPPLVKKIKDPITDQVVSVYESGDFTLKYSTLIPSHSNYFQVTVKYIACSVKICLFPFTEKINVPIYKQ